MLAKTRALLWRILAAFALLLGMVGVVVPGLPTVPFLLLAAWAASNGWPRLAQYLRSHPKHGPLIRQWQERGAVPRRAKCLAWAMMLVSAALIWHSPAPAWLQWGLSIVMAAVAGWLWRRPDA